MKKIAKILSTAALATAPFLGNYGIVAPVLFIGGLTLMIVELKENEQWHLIALNVIGIAGWLFTILT